MKKEIDQYIGNKIYKIRAYNNWSRNDLVNIIGGTQQQLWKYEKGLDSIPISKLVLIAKVFKVRIESFFPETKKSKEFVFDDEDEIKTLVNNYTKIKNVKCRKAANVLVEALATQWCFKMLSFLILQHYSC
jgi:transcriptional regulator with XRE-family HTH domain